MSVVEEKTRKLRAYNTAVGLLFFGMLCCLIASRSPSVGSIAIGVYVPFATGVGAALGLFINGNVRVHEAQSKAAQKAPNERQA